ncbi:MAG TPA: AI-2E family transporter [Steroidobacteraceae bacterium]|jgi:predicted PurR-regulated permease PerM|nr:AI-2E family transporter [Steroidobacteraceae bacterium]
MDRITEEETRARAPRRSLNVMPLRVLALSALGAVLYFGHAAFVPVVLAVLFSLVLTTPVEALHRRGLPRGLGAALILLSLMALLGGAVNMVWAPAQSWWSSAPRTLRTIERRLRPVSRMVDRIEVLTDRADQIASGPAPVQPRTSSPTPVPPAPQAAPAASRTATASNALTLLDFTRAAIMQLVTIVITMMFLLTGGPPMLARMSAALSSDVQSSHMLKVINAVRSEVGRYYGSIALINIGLGLATAGVTMALGMPSPFLWGAVAAVFNFVPYVGSATTLLLLILVAFVSFDTLGRVFAVGGCYLALAAIEGQIVQPLVVGRRLELNPLIVFLALWFGGWFWGIAGIVIAVPTLVSIKVIAEHVRGGRPLQEFLNPNELHRYHPKHVTASLGLRRSGGG